MIGVYISMGVLFLGLLLQGYWIKEMWVSQRMFRAKMKVEESHLLLCAENLLQLKEELHKTKRETRTAIPARSAR